MTSAREPVMPPDIGLPAADVTITGESTQRDRAARSSATSK